MVWIAILFGFIEKGMLIGVPHPPVFQAGTIKYIKMLKRKSPIEQFLKSHITLTSRSSTLDKTGIR
jgi:hypothetical protein